MNFIERIDSINTNPKSAVLKIYGKEIHHSNTRRFLKEGLWLVSSWLWAIAMTQSQILIAVLEDSIIFASVDDNGENSFHKRMFWNDINKYKFEVKVKKFIATRIRLSFELNGKQYTTDEFTKKKKNKWNHDSIMTENILNFLLEKINNKDLKETVKSDKNNISQLSDNLTKLNELKEKGILTEEEFTEQKKKLL
jgi:hypothetical protein